MHLYIFEMTSNHHEILMKGRSHVIFSPQKVAKTSHFRLERNDSASHRWSHWRPTQSYAPTMMRRLQAAEEVSGDIMRIQWINKRG